MARFIRAVDGRYINSYHIADCVPAPDGNYLVRYPAGEALVEAASVLGLVHGRSEDAEQRRMGRRTRQGRQP